MKIVMVKPVGSGEKHHNQSTEERFYRKPPFISHPDPQLGQRLSIFQAFL